MSGERSVRHRPECLIIAAGKGSRLSALGEPKPLVPLGGRPLIAWVMAAAARAGVGGFQVVTGYLAAELRARLGAEPTPGSLPLAFVENDQWERENGLSVACAAPGLAGPFVLLMSDHVFDSAVLERLLAEPIADDEVILAVDRRLENHPTVDLEDVTKVLVREGRIVDIGKGLAEYNAFDTGIFLCTPALFPALAASSAHGDNSLSGGIRVLAARGKARVFDVGDGLWIDVDDAAAYERAERLFLPSPAAGGAVDRPRDRP